jgi:hypothetical protein
MPDIVEPAPDNVTRAVAALTDFGGHTLNRQQAGMLIRHWRHYRMLTTGEVTEIVGRFIDDPAEFLRPRSWDNPAYGNWR